MPENATAETADLEATHWPCACIRRKRAGVGFYIKLNPNTRAKCRVCHCTQAALLKKIPKAA